MEAAPSRQRNIISERKVSNNSVTVGTFSLVEPVPVSDLTLSSWHSISCTQSLSRILSRHLHALLHRVVFVNDRSHGVQRRFYEIKCQKTTP